MQEERVEERGRQSKDRKVNREGKLLVDFIGKKGWVILKWKHKRK